jgi:uncharacterized membrane protein YccC
MLALAGPAVPDTQPQRRELVRRVIVLEPDVDQALGASSHVRYHASTLQGAIHGLMRALDGWSAVATHLGRHPEMMDRQGAEAIFHCIPPALLSAQESGSPARWIADPTALSAMCEEAMRRLLALPAGTPSLRLLADESARVLEGILHALDGLALLTGARGQPVPHDRGFKLTVADWLPALVNGGRAFVTIAAVELFWVVTAWPNGAFSIIFAGIAVLLLAPKGDVAFLGAIAVIVAVVGGILCAAIIKFAVLPAFQTFPAFCFVIGIFLIPVGFAMVRSRQLALVAVFTAMAANFIPLLAPTNQMSYDTAQFYNTALAAVVGCSVTALAFRLLPPLPPPVRVRRLLALTLHDLRGLALASLLPTSNWESRMYARLAALPDQAESLQRAQLLAALSVGSGIILLRHAAPRLRVVSELDTALEAFARGNSAVAIARLHQLDQSIASNPDTAPEPAVALRARGRILVLSEALAEHASYFDAGAIA